VVSRFSALQKTGKNIEMPAVHKMLLPLLATAVTQQKSTT
jgi:hypothetical protein